MFWLSLVKRSFLAKSLSPASRYPAKKPASCSGSLGRGTAEGGPFTISERQHGFSERSSFLAIIHEELKLPLLVT